MNIEDIENLQATLKSLVRSNFNINLVGINGCGKTNLVRENYFELFDESGLYLTFTDFMNKEILFRKFHEFLEILVEDTIIRTNSIIEFLASKFTCKTFTFFNFLELAQLNVLIFQSKK